MAVEKNTLTDLKTLILDGLESGELQPPDLTDLKRLSRLRKEAKELGLTDYRDLDPHSLKDLVSETWTTYLYNAEAYQDLEDYEKRLKDQGVTGGMLEELLSAAIEDNIDEEEATD